MSTAARVKTWIAEILTHTDLNAEFDAMVTPINTKYDTASMVSTNTASKGVLRDASGNFAAGTITANLTGTASLATLATTATTAIKATNIAGGAAGKMPYQSTADTTAFTGAGTENQYMRKGATTPDWANLYDAFTVIDSAALGASQKQILAHSLGRRPVFVQTSLLCAVAEQGYSVGDEVFSFPNFATNTINYMWGVIADATNVITQTYNTVLYIPHKTTAGSFVTITWVNWKFKIRIL